LVALDSNTTTAPPRLTTGRELARLPAAPLGATLTHSVTPVWRSRRNTWGTPVAQTPPATRLFAPDWKATKRPSGLAAASALGALPPAVPAGFTLTQVVIPFWRSRTKIWRRRVRQGGFRTAAVSRFVASDSKATIMPSALMAGRALGRFPAPPGPTLTHSVVPVRRSRTKTWRIPVVQAPGPAGTRVAAVESKATKRPSALTAGFWLSPTTGPPLVPTLTISAPTGAKAAVQKRLARRRTVPSTQSGSPPKPRKTEPGPGAAVRTTWVPPG
jgi:hypothetical protein